MDIRTLHLFSHLADSLHFSRTSRACNITPSALTRTIQRLEAETGKQLFVRDNRTVALTPAGEIFRQYAEDVLRRHERLQNELAGRRNLTGSISLYCSVTAAYSILPAIFQQFRTTHPQVHIKLQTGDAARALSMLQNREVDITIAALPRRLPRRVEFVRIMETPLVFIGPTESAETLHREKSKNSIDWLKTPIIMPDIGLSRSRIDRWFAAKKITPHIYAQVAGNEAIIAMVSLGCGVGVVPQLVLEKSPLKDQVQILDVTPQLTPFIIAVCTMKKKGRSPQVNAFWEIAAGSGEKDTGGRLAKSTELH
jgi:LysR family positive regulator for ilvC